MWGEEKPGVIAAAGVSLALAAAIVVLAVLLIFHVLDVEAFYNLLLPCGAALNICLGLISCIRRKMGLCIGLWIFSLLLAAYFVLRII